MVRLYASTVCPPACLAVLIRLNKFYLLYFTECKISHWLSAASMHVFVFRFGQITCLFDDSFFCHHLCFGSGRPARKTVFVLTHLI